VTLLRRILSFRSQTLVLPRSFTLGALYGLIDQALDDDGNSKYSRVTLDFSNLASFVDPSGVVVLSNLVEHFHRMRISVSYEVPAELTEPLVYLDNAGFFTRYRSKPLRVGAKAKETTIPLALVESRKTSAYLLADLMPWIGRNVGMSTQSLDTIRACLEEIFLNITDHSGVDVGCAFAQHFPNRNIIQIAISDFGIGIPKAVGKVVPGLADQYAIQEACKEGFSTKSNVRNRGAGIPNLMRYVTKRNNGTVLITSGRGQVSAVLKDNETNITPRPVRGFFPGTLVTTVLRTDTIEAVAEDVQPEDFQW
jgi:anti-sigma regulatory factor (Ser/Thr protein kinase)